MRRLLSFPPRFFGWLVAVALCLAVPWAFTLVASAGDQAGPAPNVLVAVIVYPLLVLCLGWECSVAQRILHRRRPA